MLLWEKTIARAVTVRGIGLHTGQPCEVCLKPAMMGQGVIFVLPNGEFIPARYDYVIDTRLATTLGSGASRIQTVEHFLCAVAALRIDNLIVQLKGPELPIQDGSSVFWVQALREAGFVFQPRLRRYVVVTRNLEWSGPDKWVRFEPYYGLYVDVTIDFPHPQIGHQRIALDVNEKSFLKELAPARTFGFAYQVEQLRQQGLAQGGGLHNAVVFDDLQVMNPEGLRFSEEPVRHKALDLIGDLSLLGFPLLARVVTYKAGHDATYQALRYLMAHPECYRIQTVGADLSETGR